MRPRTRGDGAALSAIQQLCSLGLPSEMAMPDLLDAVGRWMGIDSGQFVWVDAALRPSNFFSGLGAAGPIGTFVDRHLSLELPGMKSYADFLQRHRSMVYGGEQAHDYYGCSLYTEVLRPMGGECLLSVTLRDPSGTPRGSLSMCRDRRTRPFSAAEQARAEGLAEHLALLFAPRSDDAQSVERVESQGTCLLDANGALLYCDEASRRLLLLAGHPKFKPHADPRRVDAGLPARMARLCETLHHLAGGVPAPPAAFWLVRPEGRFHFRARPLMPTSDAHGALICVDIARHLPRRLLTWRQVGSLDLSPRLRQVCFEFAEGRSLSEIAGQLGISRHTVIDHVNRLYERFGLEPGRERLQEYLAGLPAPRPA